MEKELRCKEIVGRRVRLLRDLRNNGGAVFKRYRVMGVVHTYRGAFCLVGLKKVRGHVVTITHVNRHFFEVLPPKPLRVPR